MNILHEIEDRRARRGLSEEPVDERIAAELAYSATLAPSCFNNQPWRLIVVRNEPGNAQAEGIRAAPHSRQCMGAKGRMVFRVVYLSASRLQNG